MRGAAWAMGVAAVLAASAPAGAVELLTGVYAMKASCKAMDAGTRSKPLVAVDLAMEDLGDGFVLIAGGDLPTFQGFVVADLAKEGAGVISAVACPLTAATQLGGVLQADLKTKSGSDAASFKGTLILLNAAFHKSWSCKIKAKRTSTTAPKLVGCPS